ncbi:glycoside hydrolase family 5 protein [Streptomyces lunaelactis]|uniref:glycoside hydrolase family 5 protein n=2 Tax=Streptomyces lunaelactis TaxID=1535768 RepID=UPI0015852B24|nr:cellulase family glycosylhydrolase [Streptomyces lunaelactis]NUL13320.1 cellulase family glycosylhydrolase [Streptomyces lunaelactis]NUL26170.1 cellulase family glycosylhydrolase [Streptomyces lunaelactis]
MRGSLVRATLAAVLLLVALAPVLAAAAAPDAATLTATVETAADWTPPLSTRGRWIVDANGDRFKLRSGNWHGASGTWNGSGSTGEDANHHAGENSGRIPLGLDRAPMAEIIAGFQEIGINSIRLPFSNEMIHDTVPVTDDAVAANPSLRAKAPLEVYDAVVRELTAAGFAVILNNHTNTTRWCCGVDGNERWNASQSTGTWENDWLFMARRYKDNQRVVGADLYNEVRRNVWDDPNWGLGDNHDWFAASQRVGDRILTEADPDLLIIVEGINWTGIPVDGLPHERPTLEPVRRLSHTLVDSGKLVYSAHFYDYTGPNHSGATGTGETSDPRYRDLTSAELIDVLNRQAFFVTAEQDQHFTAPVWISEFGVGGRDETGGKQRAWFQNFVDQLIRTDADFAYWPLVGWHEGRKGNGWALLHWDAAGDRMGLYDGDDWRAAAWNRLIGAQGRTGRVDPVTNWSMLSPDHGDFVASRRMRALPDWDLGARKAVCPDGQRLLGLSHTGNRGLCSDVSTVLGAVGGHEVVVDERHVTPGQDWASGYTKLQCPAGHFLTGHSVRGSAVSAALCAEAPSGSIPGTTGRTVWFDRGDNRGSAPKGGDFAHGHYKGQCADDEYAAGIAFTGRVGSARTPDALYCRTLR